MEITPEMPEWGIRVATAVHGVFSERYPATRGQGLAASRWAPKPAPLELGGAGKVATAPPSPPSPSPSSTPFISSYHSASSFIASYHSAHSYPSASSAQSSPSPHQSPQLNSSLTSTRSSSRLSSNEVSKMYRVANLDDTSGFMAAARALAQQNQANASSKDKDVSGTAKGESKSPRRSLSPSAPEYIPLSSSPVAENSPTQQKKNGSTASSNFNPNAEEFVPSGAKLAKEEIVNSAQGAGLDESDAKNKVTTSSNEIVKSTQGAGLDDSVAKNKIPVSGIKASNVDDTAGFMAAVRARLNKPDEKNEVAGASSNKIVNSAQGAGLDEFGAKKDVTPSLNKIIKSGTQDSGLVGFDVKNKETAPIVKTSNVVDDTVGFMAAARARMHGSDAKKTVAASSNEIVKSGTQDSGLVESDPNKVAASSNEIVKSTQDTGLVDSAKNKAPASEIKMTTDVDDTAGFMAAARAWKSRNMSPVYTQAVVKTPDQLSEHKVQTRPSPIKEPFKSSTKVEKASSGNILGPEKSNPLVYESTREKMSTASPNTAAPNSAAPKKPANIDDTAGFMAAARALRSGNMPSAYTKAVAKTPGQASNRMEQTQSSPVEKTFASSNKVEKMSTASPNTAAPNSAAPKKPANIDDTAGFMAAVRALRSGNMPSAYTQTAAKTPGQTQSSPVKEPFNSSAKVEKAYSENSTADLGGVPGSKEADVKKEAITDAAAGQALNTDSAKHSNTDNGAEAKQTGFSASSENSEHSQGKEIILADDREPEDQYETITYVCRDVYEPIPGKKGAMRHINQLEVVTNVDEEEDRENMITFRTWGTPAPRNKPPAQVRRIILTGLPPAWANPSKALSLVHTGVIDKINVSPAGNAHIYFCDHNACKAFFDKHPNGIGIGSHNVYVERGEEVDVVSSQLALNRSLGATRVIRAVGVDMDTTMTQLHQIASGQNRKVEKIVDSYIPGEARIVQFRFCSIEDAVRFRSKLIRDEAWKTCNIQYGKDPCEVDAGSRID